MIIIAKSLSLVQLAGVNGYQFHFATFVGSIDKACGDPIGANNSEANHIVNSIPIK
ncbi:hypothetical [Yersinia pestis KIM10+]|uniref:Uncharacterized protein n=1 Tax=Yersinia pestis TaxID=632 RepID=Q8CKE3_YERPE|nr:hypothetical [Yersinia pestis KIM10+]